MSGPGGGQFWAGPEPSAVPAALTALATSYTVAMDRPVATRRMWLDSIDLRLYRSGMALTATEGPDGDGCSLELSRTDGATVTAGPDTLGWPRLLAGLPDELRPHLEPVLGVRALLPMVQASGTSVTGRLLDVEGKTVLRLIHERPATISGSRDRLPGGLWLIPLRGYAAAGECADRIAHRAGLVRDDRSGYPAALRAAGVDPDAPSRPVMEPGLPARVAVARVLLSFLGELEAAVDGTVTRCRHRVPARLPGRGAAQSLGGQAARRRPAARPGRVGDTAVEVARRPHDAVARPRRPPAGAPVPDGWSDERPARGPGAAGASPDRAACGRAAQAGASACGRRGSSGSAHDGAPRCWSWRPGTGSPVPDRPRPRSAWNGSTARIVVCSAAARGSRTPRLPRTCTTCASGPRSCATCWRPSPRRRIRPTLASPSRS